MYHNIVRLFLALVITYVSGSLTAQVNQASRSGFTWIPTENIEDKSYGAGYTIYSAAWPIFDKYPGPSDFQMGLAGCWMTTQRTGNEPSSFYTTIEGGLGWWHDTRFGTKIPKFIMGGVSYDFYAWANGPGAGRSRLLSNGQRDWSTPGGKYGVAQLSNRLLWAPDGLNMAQSLNGEFLGYGYMPLPLTDTMETTAGQDVSTGNQCWTLFLNTSNFKGPATFFLPTFWTEPVLSNPSLEGLFLDSRPSEPNIGFGIEHAQSPALISQDNDGAYFAKIEGLRFPAGDDNNAMILNQVSVYNYDALWNGMQSWFDGGTAVSPETVRSGSRVVPFINNGGSMAAEISGAGIDQSIRLDYMDNTQLNANIMGFEFDLETVGRKHDLFVLPEYFRLDSDDRWQAITENQVPESSLLKSTEVPSYERPELAYLTPLEEDCQWQDPNGPWNNPGPSAGPFKVDLEDGSTLTYYWYKFIDQPAIVHANLPDEMLEELQSRVEKIHMNWSHEDDFLADPEVGSLAALDPSVIVTPPPGMEIGYVPIVSRQEKTPGKLNVFVLAGQSNMQGFGTVEGAENDQGTLRDVLDNDDEGRWTELVEDGNWRSLDDVYLYFANNNDTIRSQVTVGQGANSNLFGPELMFAYQLDKYYEDPVLIIKTAWGGKSLAEDFRPPSAGGATGAFYREMLQTVEDVTSSLDVAFPSIDVQDYEISGFAWFQGWNDGASDAFLEEYESNLKALVGDVRASFEDDDLPVVIASSGHGGYQISGDLWVRSMQEMISVAQENVGCDDERYGGHVGFVDTKAFYIEASASPLDAIHHFNNNALTFLEVGKAIGDEMIKAINEMSYCYEDCSNQVSPGIMSIGNRVWHDLNRDGIQDSDEPGIPGVSLVLWEDSDGDGIPDWQGFLGVQVTDEEGYYRFSGLKPGPYVVFVWSVDNWGPGEPLEGFQSTNGFVADADNDVDYDNNGFGNAFTDILSGIVHLSEGEEPLGDGDPFNCYFDYDASGNNTIDFGFYDPLLTSDSEVVTGDFELIEVFPNPVGDQLTITVSKSISKVEVYNCLGQKVTEFKSISTDINLDCTYWLPGVYFIYGYDDNGQVLSQNKLIKG